MLKAKIDVTAYPVVRIESKYRPAVPSHAMRTLEFEPGHSGDSFLLYFKEDENEDEKYLKRWISSFAQCRTGCLQPVGVISGRIEGRSGTKGSTKEVDRRLASDRSKDKSLF